MVISDHFEVDLIILHLLELVHKFGCGEFVEKEILDNSVDVS